MVQRAQARSGRRLERFVPARPPVEWGPSLVGTIALLLLIIGYPPNG